MNKGKRKKKTQKFSTITEPSLSFTDLMSMCASLSSRNLSPHCSQMPRVTSDGLSLGPSFGGIMFFFFYFLFFNTWLYHQRNMTHINNNQTSGTVCSVCRLGDLVLRARWSSAVEELLPCGILCVFTVLLGKPEWLWMRIVVYRNEGRNEFVGIPSSRDR